MYHTIGITGGTGCGKTTVLRVLQKMGFHIIDCDAVYHGLLNRDSAMLRAIAAAFPGTVKDGVLDRKLLGKQVFSDKAALDILNETVWPFVCKAVKDEISSANSPCAIDAIGLFESGLAGLCTHTVAVTAPRELRIERLMARDGIDRDYAALRIDAQKDNSDFSHLCTLTLHNDFAQEADFCRYATTTLKETIFHE